MPHTPAGRLKHNNEGANTSSLNEDLVELLVESGIARQETTFILDHRKIIPKPAERKNIRAWLGYLSSRLPQYR